MLLAVVAGCGVASGQTTYNGGAGASVTTTAACAPGNTGYGDPSNPCTASTYPSTIAGPSAAATVNFPHPFSVTISGIDAPSSGFNGPCWGTSDLGFLLKGPGGQMLEIMSGAGGYGQTVSNGSVTLSSGSSTVLPRPFYQSNPAQNWPGSGSSSISGNLGTYAPGSFLSDAGAPTPSKDAYPGLAALSSSTMPSVNGTGTFSSVFNGAQANGAWSLYLIDYDGPGCTASFGSWSLSFASTATSNATTSTTVSGATANPLTKRQRYVYRVRHQHRRLHDAGRHRHVYLHDLSQRLCQPAVQRCDSERKRGHRNGYLRHQRIPVRGHLRDQCDLHSEHGL